MFKFSLLSSRRVFPFNPMPYHTCSDLVFVVIRNLGHLCKKDAKRITKGGQRFIVRRKSRLQLFYLKFMQEIYLSKNV